MVAAQSQLEGCVMPCGGSQPSSSVEEGDRSQVNLGCLVWLEQTCSNLQQVEQRCACWQVRSVVTPNHWQNWQKRKETDLYVLEEERDMSRLWRVYIAGLQLCEFVRHWCGCRPLRQEREKRDSRSRERASAMALTLPGI